MIIVKAPKVMEHIKPAHIECTKEDIAEVCIMPGDPLRAKYIAENFLTDAKLINRARNMFGYTGYYHGKRVTVMGHGMGMPSVSIYAFELFYFFGVQKIIRIGTCGGLDDSINVLDVILATNSYTEANFAYTYNGDPTHWAKPSMRLNEKIRETAKKQGITLVEGNVICTQQFDFYADLEHMLQRVKDKDIIAGEMETFALFHIANSFDKEAAAILTVVDSNHEKAFLSIEDREKSLNTMIKLALDSI